VSRKQTAGAPRMSETVTSVARGLQRLPVLTPTLAPATHTNSYLLGTRELLLVEPASPYEVERRELVAWVRGEQSRGRTLVGLLPTHHHPDHVGALDLAEIFGVPRWLHPSTHMHVSRSDVATDAAPRFLHEGDRFTLDGPEPQAWQVLHTPGHASGHICLERAADRVLIVGDMVASEGTILIAKGDGHMATYLQQLERLEARGARLALPAHGAPIAQPAALFRAYIEHRLRREQTILAAVSARGPNGGTLEELLPLAYPDVAAAVLPVARLSLDAHLEKLCEDGAVRLADTRFISCGKNLAK
jgi:endoribonuclease LACTB2